MLKKGCRLLEPGEINFNNIKNTTIIMIMPFDLFRMGKYQLNLLR